ncbi:probable G-protein coupled receptor 150 [Leucoraja erinacea]|uniref:probable G-protein coupled receptor 150 n=1 Tax=Leucoraja erinaceus TaxID=7782 RepID=UPI002457DD29|nr:probable G-protein coupled receptor 150 [Leucoraja erinacea]
MDMTIALDNAVQANLFFPLMWTTKVLGNISEVYELPSYNRHIRIISMTVTFTLSFIGNLAVLHKICCSKRKRRKNDVLVINLAAADFCVCIMSLVSQIFGEMLEGEWLTGDLTCKLFRVFQAFGLIGSSNIVAIIALEMHHVLVKPVDSPFPTKVLTLVSWICAVMLAFPQAFVFKEIIQGESKKCLAAFDQFPRWHFQMYVIYGVTAVFVAPFCIMCVAFTRILWTIWRRASLIKDCRPSRNGDRKLHNRSIPIVAFKGSIPRIKIRTLKMTLVIIILFIVCGLPYFIIEMTVAFGAMTEADAKMVAVLGILMIFNRAVNPYVYLFFKTDNIHLKRMEKLVCFSCLKDIREDTFHRELCAIGKQVRHASIIASEDDIVHRLDVVNPTLPKCETASCDSSL